MGMLAAICTVVSMATFIGICWWAWSSGRRAANRESALLPFALPDEAGAGMPAPARTIRTPAPRRGSHDTTRTDIES